MVFLEFLLTLTCYVSVRDRRHAAGMAFGASLVAANGLVAPLCCTMNGSAWPGLYAGMLCGIPATLGFGAAWASAVSRPKGRPNGLHPAPGRRLLLLVLSVSMACSPLIALTTFWPLRVAFFVSRPALNRVADEVAAGRPPTFPVQAGLYRIVGSESDPTTGNIALVFDPNPSGRSGFVRYRMGSFADKPGRPFSSLFMEVKLTPYWSFEVED